MQCRITATGEPEVSSKYEVERFDAPKLGIVVGIRSVTLSRIHYFDGEMVLTKITRQPAVLIACDLRGTILVPANLVHDYTDWVNRHHEEFPVKLVSEKLALVFGNEM